MNSGLNFVWLALIDSLLLFSSYFLPHLTFQLYLCNTHIPCASTLCFLCIHLLQPRLSPLQTVHTKQTQPNNKTHPNLITRRQRVKILVLLPNRPLNRSRQMSWRQLASLDPRQPYICILRLSACEIRSSPLRGAHNLQKPAVRKQVEVKARIAQLHDPLDHRRVFKIEPSVEVGEQI